MHACIASDSDEDASLHSERQLFLFLLSSDASHAVLLGCPTGMCLAFSPARTIFRFMTVRIELRPASIRDDSTGEPLYWPAIVLHALLWATYRCLICVSDSHDCQAGAEYIILLQNVVIVGQVAALFSFP